MMVTKNQIETVLTLSVVAMVLIGLTGAPVLAADYPADFDTNCIINFKDLALAAAKWLDGQGLSEPIPKP
jgi:hypothetical protein